MNMQPPPVWMLSWMLIAAVFLVGVALLIGVTVLAAFRTLRSPVGNLKPAFLPMLWIAPALVAVGLIGLLAIRSFHDAPVAFVADEVAVSAPDQGKEAPATVAEEWVAGRAAENQRGLDERKAESESWLAERAGTTKPLPAERPDASVGGPNVLKARQIASDPPQWVTEPAVPARDGSRIVVSSQRFATLDEAEAQLTGMVMETVRRHFHAEFPPYQGTWEIPVSLVEAHAVKQVAGEVMDKDFGSGITGKMYRVHAELELSPGLRQAVYGTWRGQIVNHRLIILGSLLGLITLMLATAAGYFKLDDLSFGIYRGRLKLAAAALITAGSLFVARFVA